MKIEKKTINVIRYLDLPEEIRNIFNDHCNDCMIEIHLECPPIMEEIMSWWGECEDLDSEETFEDFMEGYYKFGWWLINNVEIEDPNADFYLDICW